jgi:two-component system OmpR family sensor kinase
MRPDSDKSRQPEPEQCEADRFFRELNLEFLVHELKDPLSIIETGVLMLLEQRDLSGALTHRQEKKLLRILRSSRRIRSMVDELLEVGRAGAVCFIRSQFNPESVLRQVMLTVIELKDPSLFERLADTDDPSAQWALLEENHVFVTIESDSHHIELIQDRTKFEQIIANLLKNAFHHRNRDVTLHLGQQEGSMWLTVYDDGTGIDSMHHEAIFERYKQVAPEGLERKGHGLGLAMARILARSMGGDITLESKLGQGALFRLTIPLIHGDDS